MKFLVGASSVATAVAASLLPRVANADTFVDGRVEQMRRAAPGDFQEFNTIFENATILLPEEYQVSEQVAFVNLEMNIRDIKCYDIAIGDMAVAHDQVSPTAYQVEIVLREIDLTCEMGYNYTYGILSGDGWVQIRTENNVATTKLNFISEDFDTQPPTESAVESCSSNVKISKMDFEEDLASEILEVFQGLVRNVVEKAIGEVSCNELSILGTTLVGNMIQLAGQNLIPYQGNLGEATTDPLYLERNLYLPTGLVPLNLQDTDGDVGKMFNQILQFFDSYLGANISDPTGSTSTGNDLAVNTLLRSFFLDDNRDLTVDPSRFPSMEAVLFEGHDLLTKYTITLDKVRVKGLDTFTRFNPFRSIGRHTIQNELTWDSLTAEFDITVDIKPSKLDDAILQDPTSPGISERITVDFTIDKVDVEASLLLVLDEVAMGAMVLGPLFYSEHLLPCLLSVVHETKLSGFRVDPKYVNEPTLTGFLSPGIDRIITDSVEAAFAMYSGVLRAAIPNIFQTSVRDLINSLFIDTYMNETGNIVCSEVTAPEGFVDFRKLFDSDENTYGDLPPMLKKTLDDELLTVNPETGRPRINEALLAPFTKAQSGIEGTLEFPVDLMSLLSENLAQLGLDSIGLRIFNPKIENIDTMGAPIELLKPNATNGMVIDNFAILGLAPNKLSVGLKGLLVTEGDPSLTMLNEMDISVLLEGSEAFASLMAKIDATKLFNFPLKDITNIHCWLNTLGSEEEAGFAIQSLLLTTPAMNFNMTCSQCTSPSLSMLPNVLGLLEDAGVSDVLERRLVTLGLDLLESDFVQSYIDGLLKDAALRCPHSPAYVGPSSSTAINLPNFPSLPYESLETVAFAGAVVAEIAAIMAVEAHQTYDVNITTPLSGQNGFARLDEMRLIDFASLGTSVGDWAQSGVDNMIEYLEETISDPKGPNGKDLRVNTLIRSFLLNDDGYFSMSFDELNVLGYGIDISFKELNVMGLDTITELEIMDAIAPQTIQNGITLKKLGLEFVVSLLASNSGDDSNGRTMKTMQDISVSVELSDVNLSLAMLLALDIDLLGSMKLSSVLEMKNILPCLLTAAHAASATEFELSVGSIDKFAIEGFRSGEISSATSASTRIILEKYGDKIISSLPKFFDSTVRTVFNNWMRHHMGAETSTLCRPSMAEASATENKFVDLRDLLWTAMVSQGLGGSGLSQYGDLFSSAMGFVRNLFKVDETTGLSGLNDAVVDPLTDAGSIRYANDLFNGGTRVTVGALDANVQFRVFDAMVENLNTIGAPLQLLGGIAKKAYDLNNTVTFGAQNESLRLSTKVLVALDGDGGMQIKNEVDLSVDLLDANVIVATMSKIAENGFFNFPLRDILNMNCWLATMPAPTLDSRGLRMKHVEPTASITELAAHVGQLAIKAKCINCSSPRMFELTELLSAEKAQDETTEVANSLLEYVTQLMGGNFVQVQIDRLLNDASRKCPHSPAYDPNATAIEYEPFEAPEADYTTSYLILLGGVTVAMIVFASTIILAIRCIVRRRHKKWVARLLPHQIKQLARQQREESQKEDRLNVATKSMFKSHDIPCILRWGVPVILLLNIVFFLSGHLSLGATVNIDAQIAGETFTIEKFFEFSIAQSTVDIWNAGGKELAILIVIFSGIWPYTKILLTLALWFMSPSQVSVNRRGSILFWLDWLAKWSFIDIFILVISIAAFRVSIQSPDTSYLPDDFYSIEMMVVPLWGLYANLIAQLISQISSHVVIHYHRRIVMNATEGFNRDDFQARTHRRQSQAADQAQLPNDRTSYLNNFDGEQEGPRGEPLNDGPVGRSPELIDEENDETPASLSKHQFSRPHRGETEKLVVRSFINKLLVFAVFCFLVLVVVGCTLPSFSLEIFGLVGVAIEFGQDFDDATTDHSVFSVVKLLFEEAKYLGTAKDYVGLGTLSIVFLSTTLFIPVILSIALLRQWFTPSTVEEKRKMSIRIESLQAWQYLEVYLVAVFVASWQLGPVSNFMINSYCQNLEDLFAQMVYYGVLREEDAQCFSVTSSVEKGSFFLVAAAVVSAFLGTFVVKAVAQYLREEAEHKHRILDDGKSMTFSDETSHTEDEDAVEGDFGATIHPVPVLFTDSFRWLLRADRASFASSTRALFADPGNSHWELPEATVIVDESTNDGMLKGTYVSDLGPSPEDVKAKGTSRRGGSLMSFGNDSMSAVSRSAYSPDRSMSGRKLTYDDHEAEKNSCESAQRHPALKSEQRGSFSSLEQMSIQSKMESMDSSFRDEASTLSDNNSLVYSVPSSMDHSRTAPLSSQVGSVRSGYNRKAPPPSAYRLSSLKKSPMASSLAPAAASFDEERSLKNSPPPPPPSRAVSSSYFKGQEPPQSSQLIVGSKKLPRQSSSEETFTHVSAGDCTLFNETMGNGDFEEYAVKTVSDILTDDDDDDVYFGESYSYDSHHGLT